MQTTKVNRRVGWTDQEYVMLTMDLTHVECTLLKPMNNVKTKSLRPAQIWYR